MQLINCIANGKQRLIAELQRAKYAVWILAEKMSDKLMQQILFDKLQSHVNVEIIIAGKKPDKLGVDIESFISKGGELFLVPTPTWKCVSPNTFCIIDQQVVVQSMYGSAYHTNNDFENSLVLTSKKTAKEFTEKYFNIKHNFATIQFN